MIKLRKSILFFLLCIVMAGLFLLCKTGDSGPGAPKIPSALAATGIPPIPDSLRRAMDRYLDVRGVTLADWAPGGQGVIALARSGETNQLHAIDKPFATRRRLTFFTDEIIGAAVCPDSSRKTVLFTKDSGGDENFQLYSLRLDSMKIERLTDGTAQNDGAVWSNRGDRFVYVSNRRNGRDFDLWLTDARAGGAPSCILSKGGDWSVHDWSPDDTKLLVARSRSRTDASLFILDLASKALSPLHAAGETVSEESGDWGPGGSGIFFTSDKGTDFRCLCYHDLKSGRDTLLTANLGWDVREIALSRDRARLAFTTNVDGFSKLYLMDAKTFVIKELPGLPRGIILGLRFHPDGNLLGLTLHTPQTSDELWAIDLRTHMPVRWAGSDHPKIDPALLPQPEVFRYPTFDSSSGQPRLIPCFIYQPTNKPTPFPVLITIHGGPESQYWPYYTPLIQYLVNDLGIAVIAPNVRGSGGYGKTYLSLDDGEKREEALRDIGALLDWIATQPTLDSSRVACTGGSYGGFLSLASMARYNGRLRAGIDCYGISNFLTFLEHTAAYRRDLRRVEYGDERDPKMREFLRNLSPITHVNAISKPLLIVQGANDPRVPLEESQQIADAVRNNGGEVWMLVAGDEGHGFRKKSNKDYQDLVTAMFLKKILLR
jgi:dipeptidyl aminopeptidase/acylaminoacyl peptidase